MKGPSTFFFTKVGNRAFCEGWGRGRDFPKKPLWRKHTVEVATEGNLQRIVAIRKLVLTSIGVRKDTKHKEFKFEMSVCTYPCHSKFTYSMSLNSAIKISFRVISSVGDWCGYWYIYWKLHCIFSDGGCTWKFTSPIYVQFVNLCGNIVFCKIVWK